MRTFNLVVPRARSTIIIPRRGYEGLACPGFVVIRAEGNDQQQWRIEPAIEETEHTYRVTHEPDKNRGVISAGRFLRYYPHLPTGTWLGELRSGYIWTDPFVHVPLTPFVPESGGGEGGSWLSAKEAGTLLGYHENYIARLAEQGVLIRRNVAQIYPDLMRIPWALRRSKWAYDEHVLRQYQQWLNRDLPDEDETPAQSMIEDVPAVEHTNTG